MNETEKIKLLWKVKLMYLIPRMVRAEQEGMDFLPCFQH